MSEDDPIETEPIGMMAYGDLEIPGDYMVKEDDSIFHIRLISETFLTVKIRKYKLNSRDNRKYVDYFEEKRETVYVIEHLINEAQEIIGLEDEE